MVTSAQPIATSGFGSAITSTQNGSIDAGIHPAKLLRSPSAAERLDEQDAGIHAPIQDIDARQLRPAAPWSRWSPPRDR